MGDQGEKHEWNENRYRTKHPLIALEGRNLSDGADEKQQGQQRLKNNEVV